MSLRDGATIADPFTATADVVALMRARIHIAERRPAPGRWATRGTRRLLAARSRALFS